MGQGLDTEVRHQTQNNFYNLSKQKLTFAKFTTNLYILIFVWVGHHKKKPKQIYAQQVKMYKVACALRNKKTKKGKNEKTQENNMWQIRRTVICFLSLL